MELVEFWVCWPLGLRAIRIHCEWNLECAKLALLYLWNQSKHGARNEPDQPSSSTAFATLQKMAPDAALVGDLSCEIHSIPLPPFELCLSVSVHGQIKLISRMGSPLPMLTASALLQGVGEFLLLPGCHWSSGYW